jgi:hypothetical protein
MKLIKRILFLLSLFMVYIILKEFLVLYHYCREIHPLAGYAVLIVVSGFVLYFIGLPVLRIIVMPKTFSPTRDPDKIPGLIQSRMKHFRHNPHLVKSGFDFDVIAEDRDGYQSVIRYLRPETERIQRKYVTQVFYTTSIAQNGFLDAILILSSSVNLVKELFVLYHGRVSNRELWTIAKMVYFSMAIGGSEGIEYATDEIVSKVFAGGVKGIPFASKILGSIADGFVNAALLARISIITENYCQMLFIESRKALYPSYRTVIATTKIITSDLIERVLKEVKRLARDKTGQVVLATVNPVGYVMGKTIEKYADESEKLTPQKKEFLREISHIAHNPFGYAFGKIGGIFRKKPYKEDWE